jgi:hypothetical protein
MATPKSHVHRSMNIVATLLGYRVRSIQRTVSAEVENLLQEKLGLDRFLRKMTDYSLKNTRPTRQKIVAELVRLHQRL